MNWVFGHDRGFRLVHVLAQYQNQRYPSNVIRHPDFEKTERRGSGLSKDYETALDVTAYAAHIAAQLGAHILKIKP